MVTWWQRMATDGNMMVTTHHRLVTEFFGQVVPLSVASCPPKNRRLLEVAPKKVWVRLELHTQKVATLWTCTVEKLQGGKDATWGIPSCIYENSKLSPACNPVVLRKTGAKRQLSQTQTQVVPKKSCGQPKLSLVTSQVVHKKKIATNELYTKKVVIVAGCHLEKL